METKYEFKIVEIKDFDEVDNVLNTLGQDGWHNPVVVNYAKGKISAYDADGTCNILMITLQRKIQ